jgi:hypothetical protein
MFIDLEPPQKRYLDRCGEKSERAKGRDSMA